MNVLLADRDSESLQETQRCLTCDGLIKALRGDSNVALTSEIGMDRERRKDADDYAEFSTIPERLSRPGVLSQLLGESEPGRGP